MEDYRLGKKCGPGATPIPQTPLDATSHFATEKSNLACPPHYNILIQFQVVGTDDTEEHLGNKKPARNSQRQGKHFWVNAGENFSTKLVSDHMVIFLSIDNII